MKTNISILFIILVSLISACVSADNKKSNSLWISADNKLVDAPNIATKTIELNSTPTSVLVFSGKKNETVTVNLPAISENYKGVKIEAVITSFNSNSSAKFEDVYQAIAYQIDSKTKKEINKTTFPPTRTFLSSKPFQQRVIELDSCYQAEKGLPIILKITRKCDDPADTFQAPTALVGMKITPVKDLPTPIVVEGSKGYNSWSMIQALDGKLICLYSRGSAHSIGEGKRGAYVRVSTDGGKTWSEEATVCNDPTLGEVPIGKGLDENGDALFWIRDQKLKYRAHNLYRTKDGVKFEKIATLIPDPMPMQITDIFHVPNVGLMSIWFTGNYGKDAKNAWGTFVSKDNGKTWTQTVVEKDLPHKQWNTEQSAVYLGDGKILAIARIEYGGNSTERAQFQLESRDYGKTWTRTQTNITDVLISTPSLIFDKKTGLIYNYYYQRGRGMLKRRIVKADEIFGNPLGWSKPEIVAFASAIGYDAGNVNATTQNGKHYLTYYSGDRKNTVILVSEDKPVKK